MFPKLKKYTKKYLLKNAAVKAKILRPRARLGPSRPRPVLEDYTSLVYRLLTLYTLTKAAGAYKSVYHVEL